MNKSDFAIITPSYAPDFERCRLLSWSVEQFVSPSVTHYIIVDARDLPLFHKLKKNNTEIITVESVLPWWIQRLPFFKQGWLSLKTIFIRNWLLQQIVKLSVAKFINKEIFVFVDSDVTFIRPINFQNFIISDKVRLFRVPNQIASQSPMGDRWYKTASRLLGINNIHSPFPGYVGNLITWKRDNLLKLYDHIERVSGQSWIESICRVWDLSEYVLYGVFVDCILQEKSEHYYDSQSICHEYWSTQPMLDEQLVKFFAEIQPDEKAVMISAKAGISVEKYQNIVMNQQI
jgi:hypothetical protein